MQSSSLREKSWWHCEEAHAPLELELRKSSPPLRQKQSQGGPAASAWASEKTASQGSTQPAMARRSPLMEKQMCSLRMELLTELTWKKKSFLLCVLWGEKDFGGSYKNKAHGKVDILKMSTKWF